MKKPCPTCPWRTDAVGEFPAEAFRISAHTAYDAAISTFACHSSGKENPCLCAGFVLKNSRNNIGVRLILMKREVNLDDISDGGLDLFDSYKEMAIANGVSPDDPVLQNCRADDESYVRK